MKRQSINQFTRDAQALLGYPVKRHVSQIPKWSKHNYGAIGAILPTDKHRYSWICVAENRKTIFQQHNTCQYKVLLCMSPSGCDNNIKFWTSLYGVRVDTGRVRNWFHSKSQRQIRPPGVYIYIHLLHCIVLAQCAFVSDGRTDRARNNSRNATQHTRPKNQPLL